MSYRPTLTGCSASPLAAALVASLTSPSCESWHGCITGNVQKMTKVKARKPGCSSASTWGDYYMYVTPSHSPPSRLPLYHVQVLQHLHLQTDLVRTTLVRPAPLGAANIQTKVQPSSILSQCALVHNGAIPHFCREHSSSSHCLHQTHIC